MLQITPCRSMSLCSMSLCSMSLFSMPLRWNRDFGALLIWPEDWFWGSSEDTRRFGVAPIWKSTNSDSEDRSGVWSIFRRLERCTRDDLWRAVAKRKSAARPSRWSRKRYVFVKNVKCKLGLIRDICSLKIHNLRRGIFVKIDSCRFLCIKR